MTSAEDAFHALFTAHFRAILGFAARRCNSPADAADAAAETMTIAWRRLGDVPPGTEARWWLYGVARRVLANQTRSTNRQDRLIAKLAHAIECVPPPEVDHAISAGILAALHALRADEREVLELAAWEQLSPGEIGRVLGINPVTARTRLHRARRAMRGALATGGNDRADIGHPRAATAQPAGTGE